MKRVTLLFALIVFFSKIQSQVIDPNPGLRLDKHVEKVKKIYTTVIKTIEKGKENEAKSDTTVKEEDTVTHDQTDNNRIAIYGLTSLNNSTNDVLNSLNGTGRLGVMFFPSLKRNFKINMGVNLLNANPPTGIKRDSVDFNSLMFPETGNFGYMFSPSLRLAKPWNGENSIWLEGSFAYRKVAVDSPSISFKTLSYNVGIKYQWDYIMKDTNRLIFTIMPYWNYFNIPDEDVRKFKSLIDDPLFDKTNNGAEIQSIGVKNTVQYKNFIFFFDLRYNMQTKDLDEDNPLRGTKVNVGFVTAFSLKSF